MSVLSGYHCGSKSVTGKQAVCPLPFDPVNVYYHICGEYTRKKAHKPEKLRKSMKNRRGRRRFAFYISQLPSQSVNE